MGGLGVIVWLGAVEVASPGPSVVEGEGAVCEVRAPARNGLAFAVSAGALEPAVVADGIARARWTLAEASRPAYAVVAAFEGGTLVGWIAKARAAPRMLRARGMPNQELVVIVGERRFVGRSQADGVAHVPVEVAPGVTKARVVGIRETFEVDLAPPPLSPEHELTAPDATRWLFRTDARGKPADGPAPSGAVRVAEGAYRFSPLEMRPTPSALEPTASNPQPVAISIAPRADADAVRNRAPVSRLWGAGAGATLGRAGVPGIAVHVARSTPAVASVPTHAVGFLVLGHREHAWPGRSDPAQQWGASFALLLEAAPTWALGGGSMGPLAGAGPALSWRAQGFGASELEHRVEIAATSAAGVRYARGPWAIEARGLLSSGSLGVESAQWLVAAAAVWHWGALSSL